MSSLQHKLDRVRRPRVQITYDVETNGAIEKIELPFVVGVLADLSGQPKVPLKPLKDRAAANIDRDNFNTVLEKSAPRLAMSVPDRLTGGDGKLSVELNFKSIEDFEPAKVAAQVAPLKELLNMRHNLSELLSKMEGNDKLEQLLADVLASTDKATALAQAMGVEPGTATPDGGRQMSTAEETQSGAAAEATTVDATSLLDQVIAATKPPERSGGRPRQGLLQAVHRQRRPAGPGDLPRHRVDHQDLDRRDRQEALVPAQRGHAHPRVPEARGDPGGACTTWSTRARPARASRSACSTSARKNSSRTSNGPPSSTRARCSSGSTRKNTASSAASPTG